MIWACFLLPVLKGVGKEGRKIVNINLKSAFFLENIPHALWPQTDLCLSSLSTTSLLSWPHTCTYGTSFIFKTTRQDRYDISDRGQNRGSRRFVEVKKLVLGHPAHGQPVVALRFKPRSDASVHVLHSGVTGSITHAIWRTSLKWYYRSNRQPQLAKWKGRIYLEFEIKIIAY